MVQTRTLRAAISDLRKGRFKVKRLLRLTRAGGYRIIAAPVWGGRMNQPNRITDAMLDHLQAVTEMDWSPFTSRVERADI